MFGNSPPPFSLPTGFKGKVTQIFLLCPLAYSAEGEGEAEPGAQEAEVFSLLLLGQVQRLQIEDGILNRTPF
jgi:hypothetical protein